MDRRDYVKSLGATSIAVLSGTSTGQGRVGVATREDPNRRAELAARFSRIVDMVEDAGCDPMGRRPCDRRLKEAAGDDTLLVFPSGTYRFAGANALYRLTDFGIYGEGDVTFKAPANHNGIWFVIDHGRRLLFENVDIDITAPNAAPTLKLGAATGLVIRDVEVIGRGMRYGSGPRGEGGNLEVGNALLPIVRSPDGWGIIENFVARHGGRIGTYNRGNGRVGIFIGRSHRGTIRLVDCRLEEFPNNGIYASRTHGVVQVIGGLFRNNDGSQVRLGSEGSYLTDARLVVDVETVSAPSDPRDYLRPRGIKIESGPVDTAGVEIRNTDIEIRNSIAPGVVVAKTGGRFRIANVRLRVDADTALGIVAKPPTGGAHPPPPKPHDGTIENVSISGKASSQNSIWLMNRPGTEIKNTTIDHPRGSRDGIRLTRSPGCRITGGSIRVGRYPILVSLPENVVSAVCLAKVAGVRPIETAAQNMATERLASVPLEAFIASGVDTACITPMHVTVDHDEVADPMIAVTDVRNGDFFGLTVPKRSVQFDRPPDTPSSTSASSDDPESAGTAIPDG